MEAHGAITTAKKTVDAPNRRGQMLLSESAYLLDQLRLATASVQELDNQLRGNPPARVGP